jgi:hypothetical protein
MMTPQEKLLWRQADPELWADVDKVLEPYEAPIRITKAYKQQLTTWANAFNKQGQGQFSFDVGVNPNRQSIKLNFAWGNVGPGGTHTLNRWVEELQYLLRNQQGIKILKATAYLPNTQDFQAWCQFVEVRQWGEPIQAYCVWNGDTIIQSKAKPLFRDNARDWTFDWRNTRTLDQMLTSVKDLG